MRTEPFMSDAEPTYLDQILAAKRAELSAGRSARPSTITDRQLEVMLQQAPPVCSFIEALRHGPAPRVIAEFKRASPSRGPIREHADVAQIVHDYALAGASAISVLCDRHFDGSMDDLRTARRCTDLPVLCKDFILERSQLLEARQAGADAVLLIVAALPAPKLRELIEFTHALGMEVLCEAHDEHELDRAMTAGAKMVGGNARDLRTFEVDLVRAVRFRARVPSSFTYVAESGVETSDDLRLIRDAGVDAALVGTVLMSAPDPGAALRDLLDGV
jgi:indole-3-glycerol phosphate synthase